MKINYHNSVRQLLIGQTSQLITRHVNKPITLRLLANFSGDNPVYARKESYTEITMLVYKMSYEGNIIIKKITFPEE
jgi:hypothetical protein